MARAQVLELAQKFKNQITNFKEDDQSDKWTLTLATLFCTKFSQKERTMSETKTKNTKPKVTRSGNGRLQVYTSSEARRNWKAVMESALANEKVVILIGKRAVALRPVELTYAEEEYGVTEDELNEKGREILARGRKEKAQGKAGANLL